MKPNTKHKRDERSRKRKLGLVPKEVWLFEVDWPEFKELINKRNKKRLTEKTSQV